MDLEINNQYEGLESPENAAIACLKAIQESERFPIYDGELSIVFVDDETIAQVHADFMDDPTPTDVITFPAEPSMESAGEIIISVDHAKSRADELGEPFSKELTLYLFHGWLHLAGFDDRFPEEREKMREAEKQALGLVDPSDERYRFRLTKS